MLICSRVPDHFAGSALPFRNVPSKTNSSSSFANHARTWWRLAKARACETASSRVRSMNCSGADGVPARTPCWVATLLPDDYVPVFGGHAPTHRLVACGEDNGPRCLPVQRGVLVGERGRRRRCCRERSHNVLYPIVAIKNPLPRHQTLPVCRTVTRPSVLRINPGSCSAAAATLTVARRTPSMTARNSLKWP